MAEVSLRERRAALLEQADLRGTDFCRAYAGEADAWITGIAGKATAGNDRHLALIAVGGYGRGELCPYSDLDMVLVHDGFQDVSAVADAIWYPVWDQGVHLDHSVRRPKEVLEAAAADLRVALGLLDARLVWGDAKVAEPILDRSITLWREQLGAAWLPALVEQMAERHQSRGDVAFLLEPDLKESHGGLRDVNVLHAIAVYAPLLAEYVDLDALSVAASLLTEIRVELHRSAGRELDRLLLQEQDNIARILGRADADALMAEVAQAGRSIAWVSDDAWQRRRFWQPALPARRSWLRRRSASIPAPDPVGADREVERGIVIVGGEVALLPNAPVIDDPSLAFRLAAVAAELGLPIARSALHRLADRAPEPSDPWPIAMRHTLVRLLATGHPAIRSIESLDQQGLMARLLPEWQQVRNKPQRNAYHRFTVDRHLLEAVANAAELAGRVDRQDLLLIGTLLHDIGKGYPGDHTTVGIEIAGAVARRMGFNPSDVETIQAMVRLHLLLPDAATRRDLDDPATIETVANAVGDRETLSLLAVLTEADSLATGPQAWGAWKAGLVADLVDRVKRVLGGQEVLVRDSWVTEAHRELMAEVGASGAPAVVVEPPTVLVAAPDRPGLLSSVAGTLALHGLDVRSADVTSGDGVAAEVFTVEVTHGRWPDSDRLRRDLDAVLAGEIALEDQLAERARAYSVGRPARSARPVVPHVLVDNGASASSTVIEVRATDEVGLLHRVTRVLFDCELDVVSARVSTIGTEVVDAFYVRDVSGAKVTDAGALGRVEAALRSAVE